MKSFKSLAIAVSGLCVLPATSYGKEVDAGQMGMAMMRLNAAPLNDNIAAAIKSNQQARVSSSNQHSNGSIWKSLSSDFRMAEVNSGLVRSHESKFANNSAYFQRTIERSQPYMYHIANEVKKRGMPAEIALLPFIESAYVTKARSHVGASGLWQFMPATGRHYGLEQTPLYDGRHDVYAATDAALNYLQYLHGLFGDWSLALAAYNWGEGNVSRAVRRAQAAGIAPTYENLRMPAETRNYVPKLLAVRNLVKNPQAYGLSLPNIQNKPYFQEVKVDTPLDIMAAAHLANISETEFLALNPAFKAPVFIPKNGRKMLLPVASAKTFETNLKNTDTKALLSWDVFTPNYPMSLADISAQTGTSINELRRLNGISGGQISAGRSVLVAKNGAANVQGIKFNFAKVDNDPVPDTFVEQRPVLNNYVPSAPQLTFRQENAVTTPVVQQPAAMNKNAKIDFVAQNKKTEINITRENQQVAKETIVVTPAVNVVQTAENHEAKQNFMNNNTNANLDFYDPLLDLVKQRENERNALENTKKVVAQTNQAAQRAAELKAQQKQQAALRQQQERERQAKLAAAAAEKQQQEKQAVSVQMVRSNTAPIASNQPVSHRAATDTHKVVAGDTLFNIAQRYNVNVADLIAANNLRGNHIRIGQVLKVSGFNLPRPNRATLLKVENQRNNDVPAFHVVQKGDTLTNIASRYNLKMNDIKRLNHNRDDVRIGETLQLTMS